MSLRQRSVRSLLSAGVVVAAGATFGAASAQGAGDDAAALSPVGFLIVDEPARVLATDRKTHLAYELLLTNQSALDVTPVSIQAISGGGDRIGKALRGDQIPAAMRINGGIDGATIPAGGSATIFADLSYSPRRRDPTRLEHRIKLVGRPADGKGARQSFSFTGVPTNVSKRRAVEVQPPLRGDGWVVGNGCCSPPNAHRGATLSIDGTVHAPERFAIDFVQLNDNRLFSGPIDRNEGYFGFGQRIYSATAGEVVSVTDGLPEQVPGSLPEGQTVQTAGGNHVVVAMGRGRYAFYAHMQPGSPRVKRGDRVAPGDVLGLLGNTGNTDGAHLHFHVMDSPSPLQSNGLPFVFSTMTGEGQITDPATLQTGKPVTIDAGAFDGVRRDQMPLNDQVVGFPE